MNTMEKDYWSDIEVSLDDIRQLAKKEKDLVKRLYNRIKDSNDWINQIKNTFGSKQSDLKKILQQIFDNDKDQFYTLFAIVEFSRKILDPNIVYSRVLTSLPAYKTAIENKQIAFDALLLPLYYKDKNALQHIYYDHMIQKASLRKYQCEKRINGDKFLRTLNETAVKNFLADMRKSNRLRRDTKVWFVRHQGNKTQIFFRVQSKRLTPIKLLNNNQFIRMASLRTLIFSGQGNMLEIFSKGEPERIAKLAGLFLASGLKTEVRYVLAAQKYDTAQLTNFVRKAVSKQLAGVKIVEIERRNAPLPTSPTMILRSQTLESLDEPIKDLRERYKIDLTNNLSDIAALKMLIGQRAFRIRFKPENGQTEVFVNNRNIREDQKDMILDFLNKNVV